jgi:peptide/nickel transport system substrate-binding protein
MRLLVRFVATCLVLATGVGGQALAQKQGGILKLHHRDSPASPSIHEEASTSTVVPFHAVFNNLVIYKQDEPQNSLDSIIPDLAESWTWNADQTAITFKLRSGVKWHDGRPFTAKDVQCTMALIQGTAKDRMRKSPRAGWYKNVEAVVVEGDHQVTFRLTRPQPALLALLASGYSPIYPCHVTPAEMRRNPIGTGPFKFVEFKVNESIRLTRNPDYWKPGRPYLDGIEYTIMTNRSTAMLAFITGKLDMTFPSSVSIPLLKDVRSQAPKAQCDLGTDNVSGNLLINRDAPPFDNPDLRRALALTLDRKAFIDILFEGQADIGGALMPPPQGVWGLPPEELKTLVGYGPDVEKQREEGRALMRKLGYGPDKRMKVKVTTRNIAIYRDPAVILIDQLKHVYIDAELEPIETAVYQTKVARKDYAIAANLTGSAVDDPDQQFFENYGCGSERNYTQYCNPELEVLFRKQSEEADQARRRKIAWEIDRKLQEDVARPIIYHQRSATCRQPYVMGVSRMVNSAYNGWRFEDVWMDK